MQRSFLGFEISFTAEDAKTAEMEHRIFEQEINALKLSRRAGNPAVP
jgi:hypothetical protein